MTVAHALDQMLPNTEFLAETNSVGMGGLRTADGRAFPLQKVHVRTAVAGPCARSVIEQQFANPFDETLDVTWIFPLPADGAIVELELRAGDIVVVGECRAREEALAIFEKARTDGKRTALVETEQTGVHTLSLAGLPPRSAVTVRLTVVELLPVMDGRFRWQFPTTIAPRYTPGAEWGHSGVGISPDTDAVPNASRLTPPIRLAGGTVLDLEVEIAGPLSSLESSLHAVKLSLDSGGVRVAPSAVTTLNRNFILEFSTAEASSNATRAYTDGTYTVAIVEPPVDMNTRSLQRDAVFVVDISGSMGGSKLDAAKKALVGALHGLQRGDQFKLLAFDTRVERFRSDFVEYNDGNLQQADAWIAGLYARGGTEMLEAIQESLLGETAAGRVRTVLFITDGQSNDESRLLPAVANRRGNALLFTLGIDTAVNASLLKTLARVGGGACELCTPGDDIDAVVAKLETRFGTSLLSDLRVSGAARPDGQTVFTGRPAAVLIEGSPNTVVIRAVSPSGEFSTSVVPERIQFSLGALWARERVSWLEERLTLRPFEEEAIKPEIVRIALAHHIASKFTSFVCVDHSVNSHGERRHVVQPVEMPAQWEAAVGGAFPSPSPVPPMPMAMPMFSLARPMSAPRSRSGDMMYARPVAPSESANEPAKDAVDGGSSLREVVAKLIPFGKKQRTSDANAALTPSTGSFSLNEPGAVPPSHSGVISEFASTLARTQKADGSYGSDIGRTAAALLAFVLLGTTRRRGDRRRTVQKIVAWLEMHRDDARATMALEALHEAESSSASPAIRADWHSLRTEGSEGKMLATLMKN